jgi:hypothetical protein
LQIVISTYWKRWKDKSHITELKQRRKQEWAVVIVQKHYRRWQVPHLLWPPSGAQVSRWLLALAHNLPSESPACRDWPRTPPAIKETSFLLRKLYHKWRVSYTLLSSLDIYLPPHSATGSVSGSTRRAGTGCGRK